MDPILYKAVVKGRADVVGQHIEQLDGPLTPNHNTLLHVAAQFGRLQCTKVISNGCQSLLHRVNTKGETPLHIAAKEGYADIVKTLIECAKKQEQEGFLDQNQEQEVESGWDGATKEMLRATNVDGDTALHLAVRNCHLKEGKYLEVVRSLTREDPEFQYPANNAQETPLYLAADRGNQAKAVVYVLIKACKSPSYIGPGGRTALHAAALKDSTGEIIKRLLQWKRDLIKEANPYGWIPIHYASYAGNIEGVKQLLETDISIVYTTTADDDGLNTALHIAAAHGKVDVMEELLSHCPDCWEAVNSTGKNVLHIAVDMEREDVMNFILHKSWLSHLINQKDNEGNTPLHLFRDSNYSETMLWNHTRADQDVVNNKNMTPSEFIELNLSEDDDIFLDPSIDFWRNVVLNAHDDLARWKRAYIKEKKMRNMRVEAEERERKERVEAEERETRETREREEAKEHERKKRAEIEQEEDKAVDKMAKIHMIVATLITAITFAAVFAIPGGSDRNKDPEQRMTILAKATVFKAFLVTKTVAMVCSVSSVFLHVFGMFYVVNVYGMAVDQKRRRQAAAMCLILVAMVFMMLAFITAAFAVLAHSLALAIATCAIASITFVIYFVEFFNCCSFIWHQ